MNEITVLSSDFQNGGWIPNKFSGYGEDLSPELIIKGLDEKAVSLVITLDDLGHPLEPGYNHWIIWNIPPLSCIPRGIPKGAVIQEPISANQGMAYGKHCYRGPKPPFNWNHEYIFTVYAIDTMLHESTDCGKSDILKAIETHILQKGEIRGRYQRRHK